MKNALRNWTNIRVFLAVMREGSTLAAARRLGLAQPTVARRIEALEAETGLTLFERDTRGFKPTSQALAILPFAEVCEAAAVALTKKVQDLTQPRPIRITGYSANFGARIAGIFSAFSAQFPQIQLEFIPSMRSLDLMAGEADVAMRLSRSPLDPDLICRPISTARYTLFGSPAYAEKHGLPKCPEEMIHHKILAFRRADVPTALFDWTTRYVAEDKLEQVFSETSLLYAAVEASQGLAILNLRLLADQEAAGAILRCFDPPEALDAQHIVLIAPEAWRRPEVKTFAKFFIPRYAALFKD
jgi:DNA-binding transcriptional LysR family regulator